MRYIKCRDISQVSEPSAQDVPRIIWVASGELYADLLIAGQPLRIKISDILDRKALPDNPRSAALYFNDNCYKYYADGSWHTLAESSELSDIRKSVKSVQDAITDLADADRDLDIRVNSLERSLDGLVDRMEKI